MGRSRYKVVDDEYPYFFTCTIVNWLPFFSSPEVVEFIINSWKFMQNQRDVVFYAYIIMENHLHFIASSQEISKKVGQFKSFTARTIIDYFVNKNASRVLRLLYYSKSVHKTNREYQLWQEGSHPEQIQSREMMLQKIEYIHDNPVKRGYVEDPVHWLYSSSRNYAGMEGIIEIEKAW